MIYTFINRNKTADWGMIKDTFTQQIPVQLQKWQQAEQAREEAATKLVETVTSSLDCAEALASLNAA
ncbi:hypothetical protein E8E12_007848 [Didymella heteroderae]|uniref:Uncharacterized protein n=1 Tax=Didymella heteroderae TaxID=1769908 RepID=A0A9P5C1U5_9PLEO|nr:hypothetical protein E8E12_007848 [Didymella heteroderae]